MLKAYTVPINADNQYYYTEIKNTLNTITISLLGVVVYSLVSLDVNLNSPPDWFVNMLYVFLIISIIRKTFATSPTIVFIKPSNFRFKNWLAKKLNFITTLFVGVTCSALSSAINATPEDTLKTSLIFFTCYCITTISLCFFGYFSIEKTTIKGNDR
ncbi:hypothetical protein [Raoultella terrigena]|uniref:hypothetical protein n=1 Tax=Raoultella terrigena TaxID=577 RepID=UPI00384C8E4A